MYFCHICNQYARLSLKEILRHIGEVHAGSFSSPVTCGVNHCPSIASSSESLRQHIYKKHRDELNPITTHTETENVVARRVSSRELADQGPAGDAADVDSAGTEDLPTLPAVPNMNILEAAKYILKVRDGKGLTQAVTDSILNDVQSLINRTTESLQKKVMASLMDTNKLSSSELSEIQNLFTSNNEIFEVLNTEYKQEAFYEENLHYVVWPYILLLMHLFCLYIHIKIVCVGFICIFFI